ncbi:YugN family protein [Cytobacillus sp. FJAT-53684]|uniref:YugN family protein n=1 Tax=Cytobacillus mangrovibacter TaxID=3299024 RepID=A0ABW6K6Q5_9BACI
MIELRSEIEGKRGHFGQLQNSFLTHGCSFCSNFDFHQGKFDTVLWREGGETIYLRMPFNVVHGMLDSSNTIIEFGTPFVIKHVVNIGLDYDQNSLLTATTGLDQFQNPIDQDGYIRDKSRWALAGEEKIRNLLDSSYELFSS